MQYSIDESDILESSGQVETPTPFQRQNSGENFTMQWHFTLVRFDICFLILWVIKRTLKIYLFNIKLSFLIEN